MRLQPWAAYAARYFALENWRPITCMMAQMDARRAKAGGDGPRFFLSETLPVSASVINRVDSASTTVSVTMDSGHAADVYRFRQ